VQRRFSSRLLDASFMKLKRMCAWRRGASFVTHALYQFTDLFHLFITIAQNKERGGDLCEDTEHRHVHPCRIGDGCLCPWWG